MGWGPFSFGRGCSGQKLVVTKSRLLELLSLTIKDVSMRGEQALEARWMEVLAADRKSPQSLDELIVFGAWQFLLCAEKQKQLQEATRKALKSESVGHRKGFAEPKMKANKKKKEIVEHMSTTCLLDRDEWPGCWETRLAGEYMMGICMAAWAC